jgi:TonB family protein
MSRNPIRLIAIFMLMVSIFAGDVRAETGWKSFAFANQQYIITAEVESSHSFLLNLFNLSDFVIVVEPSQFIYKGGSGRFYIGQVFEREDKDTRADGEKYKASHLLKGHSFISLIMLGDFRELDQMNAPSIRMGATRFYLQPLDKVQFDQLAAKIDSGLDLKQSSGQATLQEANIEAMGTVSSTDGTSEWDRDWEGLLRPDGLNEVKIIEHPAIVPTDEARRANTSGRIRLRGIVNKNGAIQDLKVEKGLGRGLDERALQAVKNSWAFLPGTRSGEVVETNITFDVPVPSAAKK